MKYLSLVIHSNLVNGATEASTAIRIAKELAKYVENGEASIRHYLMVIGGQNN